MGIEKDIYQRTELLLGEEAMSVLSSTKVIVFGVGGVGGWVAESLLRSGITHLTIVDSDEVCVSNVNRQLVATCKTIGQPKVEALKNRLLEINPSAEITALQQIYSSETADSFHLEQYDYIIDAIDSLSNKADLILRACTMPGKLFSSMGAALKIDPTAVKVAEYWKVRGCPLGAALRKKMKRAKTIPAKKFLCVYSEELMENHGGQKMLEAQVASDPSAQSGTWDHIKAQINGTSAHITAIFGFTIAGLVIQDIWNKIQKQ